MRGVLVAGGLAVGLLVSGCAARSGVDPAGLSLTAYAAWGEARTQARGWASDSELQYVEGASVTNDGTVKTDAGYWRFVYRADSRSQQYVVTVTPTSVNGEERVPQGPPGFVLGDATVGSDWIDSPQVVAALEPFGAATRVHMVLVPTTPARWIVGDVEINATTGEILH